MDDIIRNAIARIDVMQGDASVSRGTGTIVGERLVLTALHVVAERSQEPPAPYPGTIRLTFPWGTTEAVRLTEDLDAHYDWALLECAEPLPARPMPLAELRESGGEFETYGFPDAQPLDGMVQTGTVENHNGELQGIPAFQLFSKQAAAGNGAPVKGLSGGPMMRDGALVGVLRFALMQDSQTVAGTLYACPIAPILERVGDRLPIPDPCWGLPGLPRRDLPARPFRYLNYFAEPDAELFFGRNREIRSLYDQVTAADAAPATLLYGQSGVGKSSFLAAGLLPRLKWQYGIAYIRRSDTEPLLISVQKALLELAPDAVAAVASARFDDAVYLQACWRSAEEALDRPVVIIVDQVEEVFTTPLRNHADELPELLRALQLVFAESGAIRGRVILSFRKEWYAEILKLCEAADLRHGNVFLESLDRHAVVDVVDGIPSSGRLQRHYGLTVESGLAEMIADDLLADVNSAVAPPLQILLTKMWDRASDAKRSAPQLSVDLYRALKSDGLLLDDFLDQQLVKAGELLADLDASGLVLDVLYNHTTPMMTGRELPYEELRAIYGERDLDRVLQVLKDLYLLVDSAGDSADDSQATRLAHDTLARHVRHRFSHSAAPGQQAGRILEHRGVEWRNGRSGALLDEADLTIVNAGRHGMRELSEDEARLVRASERARKGRRRTRIMVRASLVFAALMVAAAAVRFRIEKNHAQRSLEKTLINERAALIHEELDLDPVSALAGAIAITRKSRETFDEVVLTSVQRSLATAVALARERVDFTELDPIFSVRFSPDGRYVAAAGERGVVRLLRGDGTVHFDPFEGHAGAINCLAYSPDGQWIASGGSDGFVRQWSASGGEQRQWELDGTDVSAIAFAADSASVVAATRAGSVHVIALSNAAPTAVLTNDVGVNSVAVAPRGNSVAIAREDGSLWLWDPSEDLAKSVKAHAGGATTVAFSPDGARLVTGGADHTVRLWAGDLSGGGSPLHRYHDAAVNEVVFDPLGERIASVADDRTVYVIDLDGHNVVPAIGGIGTPIMSVSYHPLRNILAIGCRDGSVRFLDLDADQMGRPMWTDRKPIDALAFSADSTRLAAGSQDGVLTLYDAASRAPLSTNAAHDGPITVVAFQPGAADAVLASAGRDMVVRFWDGDGNAHGESMTGHVGTIHGIAFNTNGTRLVSGSEDRTVRLWDVSNRRALVSLRGHNRAVHCVAYNPARPWVASGDVGGQIRIWRQSGELLCSHSDFGSGGIHSLAFGPQGHQLAVAGNDGWLTIYSVDSTGALDEPEKAPRVRAHTGRALAVAFSPGGDDAGTLATAGADGTIRLWDRQGVPLSRAFSGHHRPVNAIQFSGDGMTLASAGHDGTVRIWRAHWWAWLCEACTRLTHHRIFIAPREAEADKAYEFCRDHVWSRPECAEHSSAD